MQPVLNLSEPETQNPKIASEQGALLAILDMVSRDKKSPKGMTCQKSDNLLQALVSEFPPERQSRSRSRFSESDKQTVPKQDIVDNPFKNLDIDFHPKYIECPEFKSCQGFVLYKRAFDLILKENRVLNNLLLSFSITKEFKSVDW